MTLTAGKRNTAILKNKKTNVKAPAAKRAKSRAIVLAEELLALEKNKAEVEAKAKAINQQIAAKKEEIIRQYEIDGNSQTRLGDKLYYLWGQEYLAYARDGLTAADALAALKEAKWLSLISEGFETQTLNAVVRENIAEFEARKRERIAETDDPDEKAHIAAEEYQLPAPLAKVYVIRKRFDVKGRKV